ncbi:MAG: hypothetical protein R2874_15420 [Desulfobacterales bacterium]
MDFSPARSFPLSGSGFPTSISRAPWPCIAAATYISRQIKSPFNSNGGVAYTLSRANVPMY